MLSFVEFGVAIGTRLLLGKVDASSFLAIASLILHLHIISESSGSLVAIASCDFPLFLGEGQSPLMLVSHWLSSHLQSL